MKASDVVIRAADLIIASSALLIMLPLCVTIAFILRLTGEGEVFFVQPRVGKGGKMFGLIKFATMLKKSPELGTGVLTVRDDPRILPVGRFLRRSKINEIPQLINVLVGQMSLIGPRPQAKSHFDVFPDDVKPILASVKPGLSGAGSILFRNEEEILSRAESNEDFYAKIIAPYKAKVEVWYVERKGLVLYLKLILLTALVVLFPMSIKPTRYLHDLPPPPLELMNL